MPNRRALVQTPKRLVANALAQTYATERANRVRQLRRSVGDLEQAWVVFQMGKVGSSTVVASLEALGDRPPVFHAHFLTDRGLAWAEDQYRPAYRRTRLLPHHVIDSAVLREGLDAGKARSWKVVTLVRDPMARNLSSFFQTMYLDWPEVDRTDRSDAALARLGQQFVDEFDHDSALRWLDTELGAALDVDVYRSEPSHGGAAHVVRGTARQPDVLVLQLERLRTDGAAALAEFIERPEVPLIDTNEADGKDYGPTYRALADQLVVPESLLDHLYESRYARHFYSDTERAAQRARWNR